MIFSPHTKHVSIAFLIIFLLLFIAYSGTFNGEFQFDDEPSTIENPYVIDASKSLKLRFPDDAASGVRPVTALTFALNYRLGGLDVRWYHATNFLIHIFNGILVFYLALLTMRSSQLPMTYREKSPYIALLSSAIFLLHPIQTEAVSYISQRYESLASLFYLLSIVAYIKARMQDARYKIQDKPVSKTKLYAIRYTLYAVSIISGILALGSKEIAITIPFVILLYDFYFLPDRPLMKRIAGTGTFIITAFITGIVILSGLKGIDAGFSVKAFTSWEYLMTQFRVVTTYIRLLFLPINQNLDYDFRISRSLFEIDTALAFAFLAALIIFAFVIVRKWRIGSFFIFWFFIILAPTSSMIPIIDPIFEHRAYLASAGVFIIAADALTRLISLKNPPIPPLLKGGEGGLLLSLKEKSIYNKISVLVMIILIISLAGITFQRNKVWETRLSLWKDAAAKSPMKSRTHNNLGNCYLLLKDYFSAVEEYKKAIALDENNIEAYYNLGLSLENIGLLSQAAYYYGIFYRVAPPAYNAQKEIARKRIDSFTTKNGQ